MVHIGNEWDEILKEEFQKDYYRNLRQFLMYEYLNQTVYPPVHDIFNAFRATPYPQVKAVILGQDPYHGPGQAHGMCFSVRRGVPSPPSLVNIFKELQSDLGCRIPEHGCLEAWAAQGVLLLNTVLTVREGQANSHRNCGWETFTDAVIRHLNAREEPMVFLLWGGNAKKKRSLITNPVHGILTAHHPSPLSAYRGFFGCRHFSETNRFLESCGIPPIAWEIQD